MTRMRSTMTAGFADTREVSDMSSDLISRRTMMRRLATIGLVAASAPLLVTLDAEAKRKGKDNGQDKNNGNQRHKGGSPEKAKDQDEQGPEATADIPASEADVDTLEASEARVLTLPNPTFYDKQGRQDGVFLTIGSRTADNKHRVTVAGSIGFTREHASLMLYSGYTFGLKCEGWGMDSGCAAPSDKEFDLNVPYPRLFNRPPSGTAVAFRETFQFSAYIAASDLNEDVDDGFWDTCDDDLDDIAAYLIVEARPSRGQWTQVMRYRTNQVQRYF